MHRQWNFYNNPLSFYFYGRCLGIVLCSLLSVFFALVAMPIPNLTLIFYGFALVMLWQCLPILSQLLLQSHNKISLPLAVFALIWVAIIILSSVSCFLLFPNPMIHVWIIVFIYGIGIFVGIWILYQCLLPGDLQKYREIFLEKQERCREWKELCMQKMQEHVDVNFRDLDTKKLFFNFDKVVLHFFSMMFWTLLLILFFVYIPFKSYEHIQDFPCFYQYAFYGTNIFVFLQIFRYIVIRCKKYYFNDSGLQIVFFQQRFSLSWYNIEFIYFQKEILYLVCWNKKIIKIHWREFSNFRELWICLTNNLPLCIFSIDYDSQVKLEVEEKESNSPETSNYDATVKIEQHILHKRNKKNKKNNNTN